MNLSTSEIINSFLLGGLLGLVGQGVRMLVGLKKLSDENADPSLPNQKFDSSRLLTSIFTGFVAGILATIPLFDEAFKKGPAWSQQTVITLLVAGYAGVDFIEGIFKSYMAKGNSAGTIKTENTAPGGASELSEKEISAETDQAIG